MSGRIGLGTGIASEAEFLRRAAVAIRGVDTGGRPDGFARNVSARIEAGRPITPDQKAALVEMIRRYRRQITDAALLEYADLRGRGAD